MFCFVAIANLRKTSMYQVYEIFDDVDDAYWFYETLTKLVIDEDAPLKKKIISNNQTPYRNGPLRKAVNIKKFVQKKML